MSNARHHYTFRRPVAAQLVSNNDPRFAASCPQKLAKEADCSETIPLRLNQNIEHNTVLVDGSPEVVSDAVDFQEHLVQMPFVSGPSTPPPETVGILLAELIAPTPDRFVGDQHSTDGHQLFDIAKAHAETVIMPDAF